MIARAVAGVLVAALIAALAYRARSLSASGAAAATVVGAATVAAGWGWGALLIGYFVASTLLSRFRAAAKERRTARVVEKGGARDAVQVFANGGVNAVCAVLAVAGGHPMLAAVAVGALAAAAADTWGTEIGTLAARPPRSVLTLRAVPAGTSGAISLPGSLATVAGALFVALLAMVVGITASFGLAPVGIIVAGVAGAMTDSLLGATLQDRRWCATCALATERTVHDCGAPTTRVGGWEWMNNDTVNLIATLVGGVVAATLATH
jgi:uncharacterized protein (TIGR00297 family)